MTNDQYFESIMHRFFLLICWNCYWFP